MIVEGAIIGREVECGVLEFPNGDVKASVVAEIRMPDSDADSDAFYDFDTKYLDDVCEFDIPRETRRVGERSDQGACCPRVQGTRLPGTLAVDFFVTADGPVINEINTMPGFTSISMYPKMWNATGIDYRTLISTLVDTAVARGTGLR